MNTAFSGNQVGSRVSLDVAGDYPTGLLAALAIYGNPAELINAQLRYTATQDDINAQQDAGYALPNLQIESSGTVAPDSLRTQLAATNYINASNEVNYLNQNRSNSANTSYTNAHAVYKLCRDASYSAYLSHEATQIVLDRVSTALVVVTLGNTIPDHVNPVDTTTLSTISTLAGNLDQRAHNNTIDAQHNALLYMMKTQEILGTAIHMSRTVTNNLTLVAAFNTLVKAVLKNIADPLSYIAGKEIMVTQYVPDVPLTNAVNVANIAITFLNDIKIALSPKVPSTLSTIADISNISTLARNLDDFARSDDNIMYLAGAVAKKTFETLSTTVAFGGRIAVPNLYPLDPYFMSQSTIQIAYSTMNTALHSDISADNSRSVSNAMNALASVFADTPTPELIISTTLNSSLQILTDMMASVNKVTSNSSAYSAVAITKRASNTINGYLASVTEQETNSLQSSSKAQNILTLLIKALNLTACVPDFNHTQIVLWAVNAATGAAKDVSEELKHKAHLLSRTAHNLVTPRKIAVQTASANTAGALNNNYLSRLARNSNNVPVDPPTPYKSFKASIRAKTFQPVRPSLDELVYKNRLQPLRYDSLRTIIDTKVKVAQEVQRTYDTSAFSFRQQ